VLCDAMAGPHEELKSGFLRELSSSGFIPTYYGPDTSKSYEASEFQGQARLTDAAEAAAKTMQPIDLFFFFMPKTLWKQIATETNRYERQTRVARVEQARTQLRQKYSREEAAKRFAETHRKLESFEGVRPHELLTLLALLIARSLCPMKMGIECHWSSTQNGAVPSGTWSRFMSRQRFRDISRFLHFSDNEHPRAKIDRAWKVRPVVETLQQTFRRGLTIGRWVAFDEMVIPSRSSRNSVRVYLKNKPHKYGTKLFAVCCGETSYCARIDVYCGARQDTRFIDTLSGPAAVIRNLKALWPRNSPDPPQKRVVITDREYTCVALAVRLAAMGFCSIGTVTPSRLGFPTALKYPFKTVPKRLANQRGLCRILRCTKFPGLHACSWIDNKPVYFVAHGVSTRKTAVYRKEKNGSVVEVSCPEFIADYNKYMNGVDSHDQLRLQRYSVQRSLRVTKYYKTLFFGLFDMALVNAYIVHTKYCRVTQQKAMSQAQFRTVLHEQLLQITEQDFICAPSPAPSPTAASPRLARASVTTHHLKFADDRSGTGKTRYRVCKVCSLLHEDPSKPIGKARSYCVECSTEKVRVYLCDRIRSTEGHNHMTCFQIWHQLLGNGKLRDGARRIRMRAADQERQRQRSLFSSETTT
jgi:Transposase IS4